MSEYISLFITVAVVIIAAGLIGYTVYKKYVAGNPKFDFGNAKVFDLLKVLRLCLDGIEYFIEELQETVQDIGGISRESYESDTEYHKALVEAAITIIEKRAADAGFTFKINHSTLVNIAELVIDYAIKNLDNKEKMKIIEDPVIGVDLATEKDQVNITKELNSFYNNK